MASDNTRFLLGDCLDVLPTLPLADLIYADPPFNVGKTFKGRSGAEFQDTWPTTETYIEWLKIRVIRIRELLTGTFWLHLDHRAVHDAKAMCDSVFGRAAYLSEVIWDTGNGLRGRRIGPGATHQTILIYAKGPKFYWDAPREPYADISQAMHFTHTDTDGRKYRERVVAGKTYRYFADSGRAMGSIWRDCPGMAANTPLNRESTGYPTQKPLSLLTRIVKAACPTGGLVIDPFCGSGTTIMAARETGRRGIGIDISTIAIKTAQAR